MDPLEDPPVDPSSPKTEIPTTNEAKSPPSKSSRVTALIDQKSKFDDQLSIAEDKFQETKALLGDDPVFSKFMSEYSKMHRALGLSKDHISRLVSQFETHDAEYGSHVQQTNEAAKSLENDLEQINSLKGQIQAAEKKVEQSLKTEDESKTELRQLKVDILNLTNTMKQGVGLSSTQEKAINDLIQTKEMYARELETELDKIVFLRTQISDMSQKMKDSEQSKRDFEKELFNLKERNASKKAEIDTEVRNKDKLERDLKELRVIVTVKSQEVRVKQDAVNRSTDDISILESQIKTQKQLLEKLNKDQESLGTRTMKLRQDYEDQLDDTNRIMSDNEQVAHELKLKEAELNMNRAEVKKVNKIRDTLIKKNLQLEEMKVLAEQERKSLKADNADLAKKLDALKKDIEAEKKKIEDLTRERDIINSSFVKTESEAQKQISYSAVLRQTRGNLELDLERRKKEVQDAEIEIEKLTDEKLKHVTNGVALQESYLEALNDIREREAQLYEYKKLHSTMENKLKHQQNVYESVLSERNLHSKHLIQAQADISSMKRTLKIMNFSINGFKDEIHSKDVALSREASEVTKLKRDIETLNDEIKTLGTQNDLAQAYIKTQIAEQSKLNQFVREAEDERGRQEKALTLLISERDNLSAQLMKQNDELVKVYDKIKTQQTSLIRGEVHYKDRIKAIRELRENIQKLRAQQRELYAETSDLDSAKKMLQLLECELTREQTRMKALEEELENPINVHRWRKMEGSNPQEFELIQVIQMLQKKLISKNKEDRDKEDAIEKKEELYLHLKGLLAKQVGPEAVEQIAEFETVLKDKNLQLKHMGAEEYLLKKAKGNILHKLISG